MSTRILERRGPFRQAVERARRWLAEEDRGLLLTLCALTVVGGYALYASDTVSAAVLLIPLVIGGLLLSPRKLPILVGLVFVTLVVITFVQQLDGALPQARWVTLATTFVIGLVTLLASRRRVELGVPAPRGEAMLIDLRERLTRQGALPALPPGWYGDQASRSAGGARFGGDFMVTQLSEGGMLSVAVVDVSGKGVDAGTRSLLLSGAFAGLLGALPPKRFLLAANDFLLRQDWREGFATAAHLCIDLSGGAFELWSAGHPPGLQLVAGTGRWIALEQSSGPILGLVPDPDFVRFKGVLAPGDALLLYTDGLVESRRRELSLGIDRLRGESERLIRHGFEGAAERLVDRLGSSDDDCALILLHRRPASAK